MMDSLLNHTSCNFFLKSPLSFPGESWTHQLPLLLPLLTSPSNATSHHQVVLKLIFWKALSQEEKIYPTNSVEGNSQPTNRPPLFKKNHCFTNHFVPKSLV